MDSYHVFIRPFNYTLAGFFILASIVSYDHAAPKTGFIVAINLFFAFLSSTPEYSRLSTFGSIYLSGGYCNLVGAHFVPDQLNKIQYTLGGAIFGAGIIWFSVVLQQVYANKQAERVRVAEEVTVPVRANDLEAYGADNKLNEKAPFIAGH